MSLALVATDAVAVIIGALIVAVVVLVLILRDKPKPIRARFGVFFERIEPREPDKPERDDDEDTLEIRPPRND